MHNVHGNNCQSDFCKCLNVVSARSGHSLPLLICDYDELHETMLEFLLTIKNPRATLLSYALSLYLSLSLSFFLCLSFASVACWHARRQNKHQKQPQQQLSSSNVQDQDAWLACSTHIARDYLMQRAFQTHTHPHKGKQLRGAAAINVPC